ncbi:hypothetical protein ACWF95_36270 [Streptomyces vinaceus]
MVDAVAVALAGWAGARLLSVLHHALTWASVLNCLMRIMLPDRPTPNVLGIDEFALRKVIWSRPEGVLQVVQGVAGLGDLRGGRGYLPPSMTQIHGGSMPVQRVVSPATQQEVDSSGFVIATSASGELWTV